jgi:hypothetical protein
LGFIWNYETITKTPVLNATKKPKISLSTPGSSRFASGNQRFTRETLAEDSAGSTVPGIVHDARW